jgi:acetyl-CoA carboxylase carboxyltransferase component
LRAALIASENAEVRNQLSLLFDYNTFVETSAYTQRGFSDFLATEKSSEFEGVITCYGAIDGKLVFAFAEDATRMGGAIDERHAKKITDLYRLAISNGAPVIGIFNSNGTDIFEGTAGLAAYGRILKAVNEASGIIPQIALITGKCIGTAATIAASFDFIVKSDEAELYVSSPALTGVKNAQDSMLAYSGDVNTCASYVKSLVSFLPDNADTGIQISDSADNLNRMLGDLDFGGSALSAISVVVDNGVFINVGADNAKGASTVLATVGGVKCGIVANSYSENDGKINAAIAKKVARFVNFCDAFSIPVVTLVDSLGIAIDKENEDTFAPELARLAASYAVSSVPKITVILGHAIGASFVLLGSKALGADLVYALDTAEIGALSAESGVAFAWDKYISEEKTRAELISEWKATLSSPIKAAANGEIDDIISTNELRARICSALLMLSAKGKFAF